MAKSEFGLLFMKEVVVHGIKDSKMVVLWTTPNHGAKRHSKKLEARLVCATHYGSAGLGRGVAYESG